MRPLAVTLLGLVAVACTADPLGPTAMPADAEPPVDAQPDADRDARPMDAEVPDARVADAAPVDADPADLAPDLDLDGAIDPPEHALVAVTHRGAHTVFVWADDAGRIVTLEVDGAGQVGPPRVVAEPAVRPDRVVARNADGTPWVAFGAAAAPITLFMADLPERSRLVLDDLYGPPVLTAVHDGVLVVGLDAEGGLAWRRVGNDLSTGPLVRDRFGLGVPDDAAGVATGALLRFAEAGQCVQLDRQGWQAIGAFACPGGPGGFVSDGERAFTVAVGAFGFEQTIEVNGLYRGDEARFAVSFVELQSGLAFGADDGRRPVIGNRAFDNNRVRRLALSFIGPAEIWDSVKTWRDTTVLPFARARALAQRRLPAVETRFGLCADGLDCRVDADCGIGACAGETTDVFALALLFAGDGSPLVRRYALRRRHAGPAPHAVGLDAACLPQAERCDGFDQDCDDAIDDGVCCGTANERDINATWQTPQPIARRGDAPDGPHEILVADVEGNDAYRVMYRLEGTTRWQGQLVRTGIPRAQEARSLEIEFDGAIDGRFLLAPGGFTALVARHAPSAGGDGGWTLFTGAVPGHPNPPRARVPLPCADVLAADVMNHPHLPRERQTQVVVVCPDRILRIYLGDAARDRNDALEDVEILPAGWATITRDGPARLEILLGYEVPGDGWIVRGLELDGVDDGPPLLARVPDPVLAIRPGDARWPIHRHAVPGRAPIQVRDGRFARLAFVERDDRARETTVWRDLLLGPDPRRAVWSSTAARVYAAGPVAPDVDHDEATGWWAVDVAGEQGVYGRWSTDPAFVVQGTVAHWHVNGGYYPHPDVERRRVPNSVFDIGRYDLVVISPTDEQGRSWRLITRLTCCGGC